MNVHPLVGIPGLLIATVGLHVAYTSPTAPPPAGTHPAVSSLEERILKSFALIAIHTPGYIKACFWCPALAESAIIFANAYPSLPISKIILGNLLFGGDASRIRFTTAAAAGIAFGVAGGALRVWCYRELGKFFTFEMSIMKDHKLVTTGPYAIVRHPGYTGTFMTVTSIFLLHATKGSWVRESGLLNHFLGKMNAGFFALLMSAVSLSLFRRMNAEDRALREQFGGRWDAWAATVRYMIIPGVL